MVLAFVLAAAASAVDVLNPALRNSPYENLRELEAASSEGTLGTSLHLARGRCSLWISRTCHQCGCQAAL